MISPHHDGLGIVSLPGNNEYVKTAARDGFMSDTGGSMYANQPANVYAKNEDQNNVKI
jgi:hypothetical protein